MLAPMQGKVGCITHLMFEHVLRTDTFQGTNVCIMGHLGGMEAMAGLDMKGTTVASLDRV